MIFTHHFANLETLSRTRTWLEWLGFAPESIEAHTDGIPRISVAVDPVRWPEVEMLINAVERSDPQGWPGFWDVAAQPHVYPVPLMDEAAIGTAHGGKSVIGWHPADWALARAREQESFDAGMSLRWPWS